MNPIESQAATAILSVVSLAILWKLYFVWNNYRLAAMRQDMFEIRDTLFDIAVRRPFLFKHPAYVRLRRSINSGIRFGHKYTMTRLLVTLYIRRMTTIPADTWPETLVGLPADVRDDLLRVQRMMQFRLGCHLLHLSMHAAWWILDRAKEISAQAAKRAKEEISEKVEMMEAQASEEYEMEVRDSYALAAAAGH